jgi:predicted HTH domain antitoxin
VLDHVRGPAHDGYTMQTLRVRLGVHQRVVEALIAQSHLPQVERINPVNHCPNRIVLPETVEAFERSYVSLSELAQHWRTNAFRLKKDLDRRGIEPALRNDQVGATFYSRRQLL